MMCYYYMSISRAKGFIVPSILFFWRFYLYDWDSNFIENFLLLLHLHLHFLLTLLLLPLLSLYSPFYSIILLFHCHFYSSSWTGLEYWIWPELFVMTWGRSNLIYRAVFLACSFCLELYKIKWAKSGQLWYVTNKSKFQFLMSIVYSFIHS